MEENIIEIENLHFAYAKKHKHKDAMVLQNISFSAKAGERIGLIGANGVGKSTLLKIFVGLLEAEDIGKVRLCGLDLNKKNLRELRRPSFSWQIFTVMLPLRRVIAVTASRRWSRG